MSKNVKESDSRSGKCVILDDLDSFTTKTNGALVIVVILREEIEVNVVHFFDQKAFKIFDQITESWTNVRTFVPAFDHDIVEFPFAMFRFFKSVSITNFFHHITWRQTRIGNRSCKDQKEALKTTKINLRIMIHT